MTIKEIREIIKSRERYLYKEDISKVIKFFMADSEEETEYVQDFLQFCHVVNQAEGRAFIDELHHCNQKYIAQVMRRPELKREHLPYLYLKEIEYFTTVNSYSQIIRVINEMMDLEGVPDFCMASCFSKAIDIFVECGLSKEAEKYVEATCTFANICDLPPRLIVLLECNLLQAYANMGRRKEYEYYKSCIKKYPEVTSDYAVNNIIKLYELGSQAIIDANSDPTGAFVREFCELMEHGDFRSGITADFSEMIIPILRWVKDFIPSESAVLYTLNLIEASTDISDKIEMYSFLIDNFNLVKLGKDDIYRDYYKLLRAYYDNDVEVRRHEVVGEMNSCEISRRYRDKAMKDELTQIGNRHAYETELDSIKSEAVNGRIPEDVMVFSMDVNGLKHVNDTFGHQAGDDYIRGAANCLKDAIGSFGNIYRVGGDEFSAVVRIRQFPVEKVLTVLRENLSNWSDSYGNELSMSVGYASSTDNPGSSLEELISFADEAMYNDKRRYYQQTGKDRRQR